MSLTSRISNVYIDLLDVPPGFEQGMKFTSSDSRGSSVPKLAPAPETVRVSDLLLGGREMVMGWEEEEEEEEVEEKEKQVKERDSVDGRQSHSETEGLTLYFLSVLSVSENCYYS